MRNLAFFVTVISFSLLPACAPAAESLDALQANIETDFQTVEQLSAKDFLALDPDKILLLDIREPEEYAVSRLPGAVWVNPKSNAHTALLQIGDVRYKQIVVYCSVGVRSSRFAKRTQEELRAMGAVSVSNLEQGIFGWHNEGRDLVNAEGETDAVHPYDENWGRYVKRKDKARYVPAWVN